MPTSFRSAAWSSREFAKNVVAAGRCILRGFGGAFPGVRVMGPCMAMGIGLPLTALDLAGSGSVHQIRHGADAPARRRKCREEHYRWSGGDPARPGRGRREEDEGGDLPIAPDRS